MPTAKKYMYLEPHGEPYAENHKMYIDVVTGMDPYSGTLYLKKVRWYSDAEWEKMYGKKEAESQMRYRNITGFGEAGFITVYLGNTYKNLEWFKSQDVCRYSKIFGWYTPSNQEIPNELPEDISTAVIKWEDVENENHKIDERKAADLMEKFRYKEVEAGNFVGTIGDRCDFVLTVEKAIPFESYYGSSTMFIMKDADDNTYVWTTSSKDLAVGTTYSMRGTIKDHRTYRGVNQTVLSRCMSVKEVD